MRAGTARFSIVRNLASRRLDLWAPSVMSWSERPRYAGGYFSGMQIRQRILQRQFGTASIDVSAGRRCSTGRNKRTAQPPSSTSATPFCFESCGHAKASAEVTFRLHSLRRLQRWRIGMNARSPDDFMECTGPHNRSPVATSPTAHAKMESLGTMSRRKD